MICCCVAAVIWILFGMFFVVFGNFWIVSAPVNFMVSVWTYSLTYLGYTADTVTVNEATKLLWRVAPLSHQFESAMSAATMAGILISKKHSNNVLIMSGTDNLDPLVKEACLK